MRQSIFVLLALAGVCASACGATSFQGDAQFPGGPRGCFNRCAAEGLAMQSYVFVGEYTTGCVCGPRQPATQGQPQADASAAIGAGAIGVIMQMRDAEAAQSGAVGMTAAGAAH